MIAINNLFTADNIIRNNRPNTGNSTHYSKEEKKIMVEMFKDNKSIDSIVIALNKISEMRRDYSGVLQKLNSMGYRLKDR